jgi:hypothetical protein|nr:MAG TPA_asm: ribosomal protein L8 [Caudoviricetes sp.]
MEGGSMTMKSSNRIELPRDAEGRKIPRSTEVLYDANGKKLRITSFTYKCDVLSIWSQWKVFSPDIKGEDDGMLPTDSLYLTPPDSLEQLAEDLNRAVNYKSENGYPTPSCAYAGRRKGFTCAGCKFSDLTDTCLTAVIKDVAARVNHLCGDAE